MHGLVSPHAVPLHPKFPLEGTEPLSAEGTRPRLDGAGQDWTWGPGVHLSGASASRPQREAGPAPWARTCRGDACDLFQIGLVALGFAWKRQDDAHFFTTCLSEATRDLDAELEGRRRTGTPLSSGLSVPGRPEKVRTQPVVGTVPRELRCGLMLYV